MKVLIKKIDNLCIVTINRPDCKNAVDGETANLLFQAFQSFDDDDNLSVH